MVETANGRLKFLNYLLYRMSDICRRHKGRFALNINIKYCTENG